MPSDSVPADLPVRPVTDDDEQHRLLDAARREVDVARRESASRLESIFRAAPTGIGVVVNRVLTDANARLCAMVGYDRGDLIGRNARMLYESTDEFERVGREKYDQIRATGTGTVETRWVCRDGSVIDVILSSSPIDLGDWSKGVTFTALDITDRKRAALEHERLRRQFDHAQKMESIGRLAGGVAHDFNNMLQAIDGNVAIALEDTSASPALRECLAEIQAAASRSADLTRQLLAFARRQTATPRVLDLNATIGGLLKMLGRLIGERIDLIWVPSPSLWRVRIDPSQVDQILANLAVNARDAIDDTGRITITTENVTLGRPGGSSCCPPGDYVLLTVRDTGCGMDENTLAHLFEPFYTTKGPGRGTGLGLATVYGIVKQNGGGTEVLSAPGRGTSMRVYLPRVADEASHEEVGPARARFVGTETILVVEDEPQVLGIVRTALQRHGYHVLVARDPAVALELAAAHAGPLHLLVSDVVLPTMNGRELRERLTAVRPGLRCLFVSGYTADVIAREGVLDAGVDFLQKPFTIPDLTTRVREMLDRPSGASG